MEVTYRPLTGKQRQELQGYVALPTTLFRAALFIAVVFFLGWLLRATLARIATAYPAAGHPAWWAVPVLAFAAGLYRVAGRWTGGRRLRGLIRADLERGELAVRRIVAVDAIQVEEQEDEGPTYFILTDDGRTIVFAGQYLERFTRRGFPWKAFDILETPESKRFFGLASAGERLEPSLRRPPLTWEETKTFGVLNKEYRYLDCDFDSLKERFGLTRDN